MRTTSLTLFLATAVVTWHIPAPAADPAKKADLAVGRAKKAYLLFPIRSDLQKNYLFDPTECYYLMVYGGGLIDADGKLDPSGLNFDDLRRDLNLRRDLGPVSGKGNKIRADAIFAKRPPNAADRLLIQAVIGWSHEGGFGRPSAITIIGDHDWKAAIKLTGDIRGLYEEERVENAVGDEAVKVYPVRTALSRLRTDNADCVVSFPKPFGKDATGTLDEQTTAKVKELVASLKIKEIKSVAFGIRENLDDLNEKACKHFTDKTAPELAKIFGVENYSVRHGYVK